MSLLLHFPGQRVIRNCIVSFFSHFLPPEELAKFMEKFQAVQEGRTVDESDYKEFKIAESNVGKLVFKLIVLI